MKTVSKAITVVVSLGLSACSRQTMDNSSSTAITESADKDKQIAVVASAFLRAKPDTIHTLASWSFKQSNWTITWFDGSRVTEISRFGKIPKLNYVDDDAVADRIGRPVDVLMDWSRATSADPLLADTSALSVTEIFPRVTQNLGHPPEKLIISGSPVYRSPDTNFDCAKPLRTPDIGQLLHPDSPFYATGREMSLESTAVYWVFPPEESVTWPPRYEATLKEFYSCFFVSRGATLVYFGPDLGAMLAAVWRPITAATPQHWKTNAPTLAFVDAIPKKPNPPAEPSPTNVAKEPTNAKTTTNITDLAGVAVAVATSDSTKNPSAQKPTLAAAPTSTGAAKVPPSMAWESPPAFTAVPRPEVGVTVGIGYTNKLAVAEFHLRPEKGSREISFRDNHRETERGRYFAGFDSRTGETIKWIHLPAGLDRGKAEVWLNYASGIGGLSGRIIWLSPTSEAEMPFTFDADKGGRGWLGRRAPYWLWKSLKNLKDRTTPTLGPLSNHSRGADLAEGAVRTEIVGTKP
jgi:hypothetical protein